MNSFYYEIVVAIKWLLAGKALERAYLCDVDFFFLLKSLFSPTGHFF